MASDKQNKQQKQQKKLQESSFVRLSKLPMVELTVYFTLNLYNRVKSSSELLNNTLNKIENVAFTTFGNLRPVVNKFEKQSKYFLS